MGNSSQVLKFKVPCSHQVRSMSKLTLLRYLRDLDSEIHRYATRQSTAGDAYILYIYICVCIYIHTHTHTYIYIYTHTYIYIYIYVCVYIHIIVCIYKLWSIDIPLVIAQQVGYIHTFLYIYIYNYIYMYVCIYTYMYVYAYMYIHT